jgi:hypothetical protein
MNGYWVSAMSHCAISSRHEKQEIHYLTTQEADRLRTAMLQSPLVLQPTPLSTLPTELQLRVASMPTLARSFAPRASQNEIDLYGLNSLLLATMQSQRRQLDSLRQQIHRLQRRAPAR